MLNVRTLTTATGIPNVQGVPTTVFLASLPLWASRPLLDSLLLLAYLLAKVSAVAGDPAVSVALLCCSIKKLNILEYRITTIRLVIFSAIG